MKILKIFRRIKSRLHVHSYDRLIVSMYCTFETRKCIYECRCGCRKIIKRPHSWVYPHPTASMISYSELQSYLTKSPVKTEYYYNAYRFNVAYDKNK